MSYAAANQSSVREQQDIAAQHFQAHLDIARARNAVYESNVRHLESMVPRDDDAGNSHFL
jgi:hypothetical protein